MTVASVIVNDALVKLGVSSDILPAQPEQQNRAFRSLRGLIAEFIADNLDIYVTLPESIDDDIGEPADLEEAIKHALCQRISVNENVSVSTDLKQLINESIQRIYSATPDDDVIYPNNTPLGQGNYAPGGRAFSPGKTT